MVILSAVISVVISIVSYVIKTKHL